MFIRPDDPSSRASLSELSVIMGAAHAMASAIVVFQPPIRVDESVAQTDTWKLAGNIPGVIRFVDPDGAEAAQFGTGISGRVVLYDAAGGLQFSGGVTNPTTNRGDEIGRKTVLALIESRSVEGRKSGAPEGSSPGPGRETSGAGGER
ncbi:MAG: hypothetical protein HY049_16005 [Acidobacteria bacterium]|nr:hypothetical protein [Acidobacteriota bacterium]